MAAIQNIVPPRVALAAVWVLSFLIYLATSSRTLLGFNDSSELITASYLGGVVHAPGYPLLTILGKLASLVIPGPVAFRYGLFTAFLSSLTVMFTSALVARVTRRQIIGVLTSLVLAFSTYHWLFSLVTEVTMLNSLLTVALFYAVWRWREAAMAGTADQPKWFLTSCFVLGLSFSHHPTIVMLLPALAWFAFQTARIASPRISTRACSRTLFLKGIGLALLGLLPYLYLPLAASRDPVMSAGDIKTIHQFVRHLLRSDYGTLSLNASYHGDLFPGLASQILLFYAQSLAQSFSWVGVVLGIWGFLLLYFRGHPIRTLLLGGFLLSGPIFFLITRMPPDTVTTRGTLEKFFGMSFTLFAVAMGAALNDLWDRLERMRRWSGTGAPGTGAPGTCALGMILLLFPAALLWNNYPRLDFRSYTLSEDYGRAVMASLEPNAVVFIQGDQTLFIAWYLSYVENVRPDVVVLNASIAKWNAPQLRRRYPQLKIAPGFPELWGDDAVKAILLENAGNFPFYFVGLSGDHFGACGVAGNPFELQPSGMALKVVDRFDPAADDSAWWKNHLIHPAPASLNKNSFVEETYYFVDCYLYNRAVIFAMHGQNARAAAYALDALAWNPAFQPTRNLLSRLTGATPPAGLGSRR